ncbi:unnamed protein product [Polarella glacialis]|uniref:Ion transport domain-containing protein n=1 Tax=Polarella glacialis TaxID=89957 RepID=A0A813EL94_POLGL|nr:unnamed protein product [Polarella glacialis]
MPDTLGDAPPSPTSFQKVVWQIESLQQRLVEVHVQELESLHQDLRTLRGDTDSLHGACASTTPVSSQAANHHLQPGHQRPRSASPAFFTQKKRSGECAQSASPAFFSKRAPNGEGEYHLSPPLSPPESPLPQLFSKTSGEGTLSATPGFFSKRVSSGEEECHVSPLEQVPQRLRWASEPAEGGGGGSCFLSGNSVGPRSSVKMQVQALTNQVEAVAQTRGHLSPTKVVFNLHEAWAMDDDHMLALKCEQMVSEKVGKNENQRRREDSNTMVLSGDLNHSRWTLHPSSRGKLGWDILLLMFLCYDLVTVPLQAYDVGAPEFLRAMDILVVMYWSVDIVLAFFTGVYVDGVLVMQSSTIAKKYVYSWFFFDFLVLVPEWVAIVAADVDENIANSMSMMRASRARRFMRLVRLLKLMRILKVKSVVDGLKSRVGTATLLLGISMFKLTLITLMLIHDLSCLWFLVGNAEGGWVYETGLQERPFQEQYFQSFSFSLSRLHQSSMTSNLELTLPQEQALSVAAIILAMIYSSVFISSITNLMMDVKRTADKRNQKIAAFRDYATRHGISTMLSVRLTRYLEREHDSKMREKTEMELQQALPQELLKELFHEARSPILSAHSLFASLGERHRRVERDLCMSAASEVHFLANDRIFSEGDSCSSMYFVNTGDLSYTSLVKSGTAKPATLKHLADLAMRWKYVRSLSSNKALEAGEKMTRGEWLSEPVLWCSRWEHRGDLWANSDGSFVIVKPEEFVKVIQAQKSALIDVTIYARCFVQELATRGEFLSDLAEPEETPSAAPNRFGFGRKNTKRFVLPTDRRFDNVAP